jgi:hypothetical protein
VNGEDVLHRGFESRSEGEMICWVLRQGRRGPCHGRVIVTSPAGPGSAYVPIALRFASALRDSSHPERLTRDMGHLSRTRDAIICVQRARERCTLSAAPRRLGGTERTPKPAANHLRVEAATLASGAVDLWPPSKV